MRSTLMPVHGLASDQRHQKAMYETLKVRHQDPVAAESALLDLPIQRARASYQGVDGNKRAAKPVSEDFSVNDRFFLKCFPLHDRHVRLINTIMLEEVSSASVLTYKGGPAMLRILKSYFEDPTTGLKTYVDETDLAYQRLLCLKRAVSSLGGAASITAHKLGPEFSLSELSEAFRAGGTDAENEPEPCNA